MSASIHYFTIDMALSRTSSPSYLQLIRAIATHASNNVLHFGFSMKEKAMCLSVTGNISSGVAIHRFTGSVNAFRGFINLIIEYLHYHGRNIGFLLCTKSLLRDPLILQIISSDIRFAAHLDGYIHKTA